MAKQPTIYLAVAAEDRTIADVLLAHLQRTNFKIIDKRDVPNILDPVTDLYGTMSDCDVIILIDSQAFRQHKNNHELTFAQQLEKPLIVLSLRKKVDESKSTWRIRLFDFTNPTHQAWQHAIETIIDLTEDVTAPPDNNFLF